MGEAEKGEQGKRAGSTWDADGRMWLRASLELAEWVSPPLSGVLALHRLGPFGAKGLGNQVQPLAGGDVWSVLSTEVHLCSRVASCALH